MHGCPHTKEGEKIQLGVLAYANNFSAWEAEARRSKVPVFEYHGGEGAEDLLRCCRGLENVRGGDEKRGEKTYSDGTKRDSGL